MNWIRIVVFPILRQTGKIFLVFTRYIIWKVRETVIWPIIFVCKAISEELQFTQEINGLNLKIGCPYERTEPISRHRSTLYKSNWFAARIMFASDRAAFLEGVQSASWRAERSQHGEERLWIMWQCILVYCNVKFPEMQRASAYNLEFYKKTY